MRPVLLFDIETVPDAQMARKVLGVTEELSDVEALARIAVPKKDGELFGFPKPLYHQVIEVSVCVIDPHGAVEALLPVGPADEETLLRGFWSGFSRRVGTTRIATFNGRRFDVPVLVQRALAHGISPAPIFTGDYRQRFRDSHIDLMEILSDYGSSIQLSQHEMATMLGIPGKVGVDGGDVATLFEAGRQDDIAAYCTCDVATLALGYARVGVHTGWCSEDERLKVEDGIRKSLEGLVAIHPLYREFLEKWNP